MRKKIVAANWKMNMTQGEATAFVSTFLLEIGESRDVEVVIVPPFTAIAAVNAALENAQHVKVGAQNMHWERSGAFTGEISPAMLRDLFVRYVVLGHSERRMLFGGSVKPDNARTLMSQPDIDGALVGGASLDPRSFAQIVQGATASS